MFNIILNLIQSRGLESPLLQPGEECGVIRGRSLYPLLRGIIRLTLQTSLRSFSESLITTYQFRYASLSELEFQQ